MNMLAKISMVVSIAMSTAAVGQVPNLFQRRDNLQNVGQFGFGTKLFTCAHPSLVHFVHPPEGTPDYVYGYVQTVPNIGQNGNPFGSAAYTRMFFRNANLPMSYIGNANSHTFRKLPPQPQPIFGPAQFCVTYDVASFDRRDVFFPLGKPTARIQGSSADLSAVLTHTKLGTFNPPTWNVTGFYINETGIVPVNLTTPVGGITFNTRLNVSPQDVAMPLVNLRVPRAIMQQKPPTATSVSFKVLYRLEL